MRRIASGSATMAMTRHGRLSPHSNQSNMQWQTLAIVLSRALDLDKCRFITVYMTGKPNLRRDFQGKEG